MYKNIITYEEARNQTKEHCLKFHCLVCGDILSCRCSIPKQYFEGICAECEEKDRKISGIKAMVVGQTKEGHVYHPMLYEEILNFYTGAPHKAIDLFEQHLENDENEQALNMLEQFLNIKIPENVKDELIEHIGHVYQEALAEIDVQWEEPAWAIVEGIHKKIKCMKPFKPYQQVFIVADEQDNDRKFLDWAENEMRLAGLYAGDADYGCMIPEGIMAMLEEWHKQGHSGGSAMITREILNKLLNWENLTPLTGNPEEWEDVSDLGGGGFEYSYQSKRNPSCFTKDFKMYINVNDKEEKEYNLEPYNKFEELIESKYKKYNPKNAFVPREVPYSVNPKKGKAKKYWDSTKAPKISPIT